MITFVIPHSIPKNSQDSGYGTAIHHDDFLTIGQARRLTIRTSLPLGLNPAFPTARQEAYFSLNHQTRTEKYYVEFGIPGYKADVTHDLVERLGQKEHPTIHPARPIPLAPHRKLDPEQFYSIAQVDRVPTVIGLHERASNLYTDSATKLASDGVTDKKDLDV